MSGPGRISGTRELVVVAPYISFLIGCVEAVSNGSPCFMGDRNGPRSSKTPFLRKRRDVPAAVLPPPGGPLACSLVIDTPSTRSFISTRRPCSARIHNRAQKSRIRITGNHIANPRQPRAEIRSPKRQRLRRHHRTLRYSPLNPPLGCWRSSWVSAIGVSTGGLIEAGRRPTEQLHSTVSTIETCHTAQVVSECHSQKHSDLPDGGR